MLAAGPVAALTPHVPLCHLLGVKCLLRSWEVLARYGFAE